MIWWYTLTTVKERRNKIYAFAGGLLVLIYLAAAVIGLEIIGIIVAVIATSIYGLVEDKRIEKGGRK